MKFLFTVTSEIAKEKTSIPSGWVDDQPLSFMIYLKSKKIFRVNSMDITFRLWGKWGGPFSPCLKNGDFPMIQ